MNQTPAFVLNFEMVRASIEVIAISAEQLYSYLCDLSAPTRKPSWTFTYQLQWFPDLMS